MNTIRDALVITAVGLAATYFFGRPVLRALNGRRWSQAKGTVTASRVEHSVSGLTFGAKARYSLFVNYRYTVGVATYNADRVSFFSKVIVYRNESDANGDHRRFAKGSGIDVRYDPRNPADAVIDGTIPWELGAMAGFSLFFLVAGLIGLARILLH